MQIMPSSGGWSNAAAAVQQSVSEGKSPASTSTASNAGAGVERLDASGKTTDRDANERYDGPDQRPPHQQESRSSDLESNDSMLLLPAIDEQPQSKLDLLG
jgi:hypothetical protein